MTDEDTDDSDDRMNRADRLREMREGRRRGRSGGTTDDGDDASTGQSPTDDDETATTDKTVTEDEPATTPTAADGEAEAASDPPATADESTGSAADDTDVTDDDPSDEEVEESGFEFDESSAEAVHDEKTEKSDVETPDDSEDPSTDPQSGVAASVSSTDAASAVDALGSGGTFAIPDQATTVSEQEDQSTIEGAEQSVAAARAAASRGTTHVGSRTRVLEFELGDERFCLDIDYIEEIVELENMTRVPNSPSYVEGVVDLRGQVTTIINPKDALDVSRETDGELIIVFDSEAVGDQGHLGWVVDEVRQVTPVSDEEVNDSPDEEAEHINGIINRDDEEDFVVWTTPELALNSS